MVVRAGIIQLNLQINKGEAMAKATKAKTTTTTKKVVKKPAVSAKRVTTKKRVSKQASEPEFMQVRVTDQTLYWLIFGAAAITFALWLFSLDAKVRDLYDQIDANTYSASSSLDQPAETDSSTVEE